MKKTAIAFALTAPAWLVGCNAELPTQETAEVVRPALVETVSRQVASSHQFYGSVRAADRADLSFRTSGRLAQLFVEKGDRVTAGQVLAKLDAREAELRLSTAVAELNNIRAEHRRALVIFEKSQAISVSDMEEITTSVELAHLRVKEAQRNLEETILTAPFDGIIGQRLVDNHTQVAANTTAFVLHNLDQLEVAIQVPDRVVASGGYEVAGLASLSALPGQHFDVVMNSFATEADPATQTYEVTFRFIDLNGAVVLPGMAASVTPFADGSQKYATVPLTAVVPDNLGQQSVWLVDQQDTLSRRNVTLGEISNDRVVIHNLSDGERVVVAGLSALVEGTQVLPVAEVK
ncbi:efflux RND transporter periplasmic adaptor subunit [Marinobacter hydrocarbonoclasticus]|nr:efflux RND transporter periplasmic adaptor subunit [Marinobacter nauticus]